MHFKWLLYKSIDNLIGTQIFYVEIDNLSVLQKKIQKSYPLVTQCDVATLVINHKERLTMKVEIY